MSDDRPFECTITGCGMVRQPFLLQSFFQLAFFFEYLYRFLKLMYFFKCENKIVSSINNIIIIFKHIT